MRSPRFWGAWRVGRLAAIVAIVPLGCAVGIWLSWIADNAVLRNQALAVTAALTSDAARISAVNDWVYHDQGFAKNRHFFAIKALGPTPLQVMESGGDCADKSRLVSAMLRQLGIDSGLLMISPCRDCAPIHTVVEARYPGGRMIVDPVWGVDYPAVNGKYLGARELAATGLGPQHIADLQRRSAPDAKIRRMPAADAEFDFAAAMNWNKNLISRAAAYVLEGLGIDPGRLMRPHLLEDPKLALSVLLAVVAVALMILGVLIGLVFPGIAGKFDRVRAPRSPRARHA